MAKKAAGQDAPTAAGCEGLDRNQEAAPDPQAQQQNQQQADVQPQRPLQQQADVRLQTQPQTQPQVPLIVVHQQQQQQQQQQPSAPAQQQQLPQGGAAVYSGVPAAHASGVPSQAPAPQAQPALPQHIGAQQPGGLAAQQALLQHFQPFGAAGPNAMDAAQQAALLQQLQWQRMSQWQNGGVSGLPAFPHQQQQQQAALALLLQQQQQQQQAAAGSAAPPAAASAPQGIGIQHSDVSTPLDVQQQQALLQQLQAAQQRQQQAALLQQLQASQRLMQGQLQQPPQQQQPASVAQLPPQFQGQQVT